MGKKVGRKLEQDGVEVVIDYKDLRLGHDKYAFMERIVADETIDKVLLICNESYKYKADSRSGGVGEESAIITSQVYGNVRQEKFIPIVNEYDENGMPYLPNYLAARMYADLTDFNAGYEELLSNILGEDKKDGNQNRFKKHNGYRWIWLTKSLFDYRVGKGFPGLRGVKEFNNPKECVDRLEILLRNPLNRNKRIWQTQYGGWEGVVTMRFHLSKDWIVKGFGGWKAAEGKENSCIFIFGIL